MKTPISNESSLFHDKAFLLLVVLVTLAFAWILWPFFGAVFWALVFAIVFAPLYRRLSAWLKRRTLAALATVAIIMLLVILPAAAITGLLTKEGMGVYQRVQSGELDFGRYFQQVLSALPAWASALLDRYGLLNLADVQERFSAGMTQAIKFVAAHVLDAGQNTFEFIASFFIMLYVLFFLLRDGNALSTRIRQAIPLQPELQNTLATKFATAIRATIKGNIVVAIIQGALGGLMFWFLDIRGAMFWAVLMTFLSLLPAVGTALVWLPVAVYLMVTGETWQGIALIAYGVLVIGLIDNLLRPILVGKDTKLPDYVVLIATLGGLAIFGWNGFVIGPVIAAMFIALWDIVATSRAHASGTPDRPIRADDT